MNKSEIAEPDAAIKLLLLLGYPALWTFLYTLYQATILPQEYLMFGEFVLVQAFLLVAPAAAASAALVLFIRRISVRTYRLMLALLVILPVAFVLLVYRPRQEMQVLCRLIQSYRLSGEALKRDLERFRRQLGTISDPNLVVNGESALHLAIRYKQTEEAGELLRRGAVLHAADLDFYSKSPRIEILADLNKDNVAPEVQAKVERLIADEIDFLSNNQGLNDDTARRLMALKNAQASFAGDAGTGP